MGKNLVICCDGTNNQFGSNNTNVVKLVQALDRNPAKQVVYYDPGVGTMPEPGFVTPIGKWISKVFGLGFGAGLSGKIAEAYTFLMDQYQPGDRIYMYGFSRGAYTVRALAGVLNQFGLLPPGAYNLIPYALRYSKAINQLDNASPDSADLYWNVCAGFKEAFSRINVMGGKATRRVPIHFLGLWDTVSSVGWVWEPVHFPYTTNNPSVEIIRHAISLDEHRAFFRQNRWTINGQPSQDALEVWFPGVHCDVGGGYAENDFDYRGGLWRAPFLWMIRESVKAGLVIRNSKVREILKRTPCRLPVWAGQQHESLDWRWWLAEFLPKMRMNKQSGTKLPHLNLFRHRTVSEGTLLHRSVLRRIRKKDLNYAPPNLSREFLEKVRALKNIPETLPYQYEMETAELVSVCK